jgi:hypothetical protein
MITRKQTGVLAATALAWTLAACGETALDPQQAIVDCVQKYTLEPVRANEDPLRISALYRVTGPDSLQMMRSPFGAPTEDVTVTLVGGNPGNTIERIMADREDRRFHVIGMDGEMLVRVRSEPGDPETLISEACNRLSEGVTLQQIQFQLSSN